MEKYEQISVVGEGSYGVVMKCRHRETDQIVAVKKFLETEEDATIRKMALREIRMLKRLKHENLVTMIEVFRYRKRFYLVFEYLEGTVLDELEKMPGGLGDERTRERIFQVVRAISYCHSNNIIHRDVKPENVLVSSLGVVKLCDFGFARIISLGGEACTEYVATRWYRAPELLVGEANYGPPVDVWAIGCLFAEMMCGDPLFPGESDIDQLYIIVKMLGKPCPRHQQLMSKNSQLRGMIKSPSSDTAGVYKHFPVWSLQSIEFLSGCMKMDPQDRLNAEELLKHGYFTQDRFPQKFLPALREKVNIEFNNPLLRKFKTEIVMSTDKKDETRSRRGSQQQDHARWRFTLAEGSMKRKFSCDVASSDNLITLARTSQRLNVMPKMTNQSQQLLKQTSLSKSVSKQLSTPKLSNTAEMQMLEKSLESLAKFGQKPEEDRPVSAHKTDSPSMASPPPFHSLHFGFGDYTKSPQTQSVLHPSINNISFGKEQPKKSPNVNKGVVHVPLLTNPPRNPFLKKLDRNVVVEYENFNNSANSGAVWLNTLANTMYSRRKEPKVGKSGDDFSLPNLVPGAISPNKNNGNAKKKSLPEIIDVIGHSNNVTPAYRYLRAKRKRHTLDITLPFPVKENG